jgi:hypothetical protein
LNGELRTHRALSFMTTRSKDILVVVMVALVNLLAMLSSDVITIIGVIMMVAASCVVLGARFLKTAGATMKSGRAGMREETSY